MAAKGIWGVLQKVGLAEEVPEEAIPEAPKATTPSTPAPVTVTAPKAVSAEDQAKIAELDRSAREQLAGAMEGAGASLVEELGDTLETLKEAIPDEKARYTAALKLLIKKGHSVTTLLGDFDKCIGVLESKDREFNGQLKTQFEKRVGSKQAAMKECSINIEAIDNQIANLRKQRDDLVAKHSEAQGSISEEQTKLSQVQERFELAYRAIRSEVEAQRAKIAQYGDKL